MFFSQPVKRQRFAKADATSLAEDYGGGKWPVK
jgi:hypothetical protein